LASGGKDREKEDKVNQPVSITISKITPTAQISIANLNVLETATNSISSKNISITSPSYSYSNTNTSSSSAAVNVICRFRPLNDKEKISTKDISVEFLDQQQISIKSAAENNIYKFSFDKIFDMSCAQQEVYDTAAKPIIDSVLEGFNGTIFAYGQTSSGKTHTMQGVIDNPEKEGIIPRMIRNVFNHILHAGEEMEFTVKVSMVEIYMEKIRDLIDPSRNNLNVREEKSRGVFIEDLSERYCSNEEEVLDIMKLGSQNRATNATNMNEQSSRSHSIFIMTIHQNNVKDLVAKTGKLYLVDLAGSEKISKTGATGELLEEAKNINKSLTTLGMVINSLTDGKSLHVPYRDSKLTRVLQESLGGNARTCLIITCSPSSYNEAETLSTLRFGLRAKKIKNKPKINKEVTVAELKIEIEKLERLILVHYKRIEQLQNFIIKHNLTVPEEGDYSFMNEKLEIHLDEEENGMKKDKSLNMLEEDMKKLTENLIIDENDNLDSIYFGTENNIQIDHKDFSEKKQKVDELVENAEIVDNPEKDKEMIKELSEKYANVINRIILLEENKKGLSDELDNATLKLKENFETIDCNSKIIEELQQIKLNFEYKEQELYEKINDLQEKLDLERNVIKINEFKEIKTVEIINDNDSVNNLGVTPKNYLKDEIYDKIDELLICTASENVSENIENTSEKLNNLFNFIKNKLNLSTETTPLNSTPLNEKQIKKNYELEIGNTINLASSNTNTQNQIHTSIQNTANITDEVVRKEKKKFENEKKLILKALEEKVDKVFVI
jgi:kinesin family protein 5